MMTERVAVNLRLTLHQLKMVRNAVRVYSGELAHREIRVNPLSEAGKKLAKDVNELVDVEQQLDEVLRDP